MKKINSLLVIGLIGAFGCSSSTDKTSEQEVEYLTETGITDYSSFIGKDYLIDDQHSYIGFRIKYFGYSPVRGRFDKYEGTVFHEENNISSLSVSLAINVKSINTGNNTRDEDLMKSNTWFDEPTYPIIKFVSKSILVRNDERFDMLGELTMKGKKRDIKIAFEKPTRMSKDYSGNEQVDYSGKFTLNRQDFDIYGSDFWSSVMEDGLTQLSDEVEIEIDIHTRRPNYSIRYSEYDSTNVRAIVLNLIKEKGIKKGLDRIDTEYRKGEVTAGALSSIGGTLYEWEMYQESKQVFEKKLALFPGLVSTRSQLGISMLYMGNKTAAKEQFEQVLSKDSTNTRAKEYLKLLPKL